jgi:hypothetical protein
MTHVWAVVDIFVNNVKKKPSGHFLSLNLKVELFETHSHQSKVAETVLDELPGLGVVARSERALESGLAGDLLVSVFAQGAAFAARPHDGVNDRVHVGGVLGDGVQENSLGQVRRFSSSRRVGGLLAVGAAPGPFSVGAGCQCNQARD